MSSEKILQFEGDQMAYMAAVTLQELAKGFSQRVFCNKSTGQSVCVPKDVHVEWELKRKDSGKVKLEIEISWVEESNPTAQPIA
jgi:amphi-Trp domain-containing protein